MSEPKTTMRRMYDRIAELESRLDQAVQALRAYRDERNVETGRAVDDVLATEWAKAIGEPHDSAYWDRRALEAMPDRLRDAAIGEPHDDERNCRACGTKLYFGSTGWRVGVCHECARKYAVTNFSDEPAIGEPSA